MPTVRQDDKVKVMGSGGSGAWVELSLRLGDRHKTIRLERDYPTDLGRLPDLVDRIGGPAVWQK